MKGGSWDLLCWRKSHFSCNAISQNHFLAFASLSNVLNDCTQRKRGIWSLIFHNNHLTAVEAEPTAKNPSRKTEGWREEAFVKFGDCLNPPVTLLHGPASVSAWAPCSGKKHLTRLKKKKKKSTAPRRQWSDEPSLINLQRWLLLFRLDLDRTEAKQNLTVFRAGALLIAADPNKAPVLPLNNS